MSTISMMKRAAVLAIGAGAFAAAIVASQPAKADGNALAFWQDPATKEQPVKAKTRRATVRPRGGAVIPHGVVVAKPRRFYSGRYDCARNVDGALREMGIPGTGSPLARSYLGWGYSSGPRPRAVAHNWRPGGSHVAIVAGFSGGRPVCWNPSYRRGGWVLIPCERGMRVTYRAHATMVAGL